MRTTNCFRHLTTALLGLVLALAGATSAFAQFITTGEITGSVVDKAGNPIGNATVIALYGPTNTAFHGTTNSVGRFDITGLPVGGPYSVSASVANYDVKAVDGVAVQLGQGSEVKLVASSVSEQQVVQLAKFVVQSQTNDLDGDATGSGNVLNNRAVNDMPTVSRSFGDLIKSNPYVADRSGYGGIGAQSAALGMNSKYNNITLDGAKINDSFGLNGNGLFSLADPFSLDAIDQFTVDLSPYDVRQSGFAGADINVVSKSGTNEFHGSAYFVFSDKNWQGSDIFGTTKGTRQPLKERTYGFTLGGPLWKNHLFFFGNIERFYRDQAPIIPIYTPDPAFLSAVNSQLATLPGAPNLGSFGGTSTSRLLDEKRLLKISWVINENHRMVVRYSDTIGQQPNTGSLSSTSFSLKPFPSSAEPTSFTNGVTGLSSNFYTLNVKEHVLAGQLFDTWTPELKTEFSYSKTKQDQVRTVPIQFPEVHILNVPGTSTSSGNSFTTGDAFRFGTEQSSQGNEEHFKTTTYSGSADYQWQTFTFTAGGDYEGDDYVNIFRQGSYGIFVYNNLAAFQADAPSGFARAVVQNGFPVPDLSEFRDKAGFAQIKWEPFARFNTTLGFRIDDLGSPISPPVNTAFVSAFGVTNAGTVHGQVPAPRWSFNYALDDERTTQVRGGIGVFLGRNPWVWVSNSYGNFGAQRYTVTATSNVPTLRQYLTGTYSNSDPAYAFNPSSPIGTTNVPPSASTVQTINLVKPGLKPPTIERANLAIDRKIPFLDATATLEWIGTKQLDALFVDNMNLKPAGAGIDGRSLFAGSTASSTGELVQGFGNVIRTRDVTAGLSNYESIMLDHPMKDGWAWNISFTHGHATEANSLNSATANSQWTFHNVFNQGAVEVSRSDYEVQSRLQATLTKEFHFFHSALGTSVTLYYEGRTGIPYSFVYANDINGDGISGNDLVAVPTGPNDPRFDFSGMTAAQQNAYFAFIASSGLSKFAGSYAPRDAFLTPWQNRLDLNLTQDLTPPGLHGATLEGFLSFLNFGTWLSHSIFNYIQEVNTTQSNGEIARAFGAATYNVAPDGRIKPTFNNGTAAVLNTDANGNLVFASSSSQVLPNNGDSRWKIEGGVRLKF